MGVLSQFYPNKLVSFLQTDFTGTGKWVISHDDVHGNVYTGDIAPNFLDPASYVVKKAGPVQLTVRTHRRLLPVTTGGTEMPYGISVLTFWTFRADSPVVQADMLVHNAYVDSSQIVFDQPVSYTNSPVVGATSRYTNKGSSGHIYHRYLSITAPRATWRGKEPWSSPVPGYGWTPSVSSATWTLVPQEPNHILYQAAAGAGITMVISRSGATTTHTLSITAATTSNLNPNYASETKDSVQVGDVFLLTSATYGAITGEVTAITINGTQSNYTLTVSGSPLPSGIVDHPLSSVSCSLSDMLHILHVGTFHPIRACFYRNDLANSEQEADSILSQEGWGTCLDEAVPISSTTPDGRTFCWQNSQTANYLVTRYRLPSRQLLLGSGLGTILDNSRDVYFNRFETGAAFNITNFFESSVTNTPRSGMRHPIGGVANGVTGGSELYLHPGVELLAHTSSKAIQGFIARERGMTDRHAFSPVGVNGEPVYPEDSFAGLLGAGHPNDRLPWNIFDGVNSITNTHHYPLSGQSQQVNSGGIFGFSWGELYNRQVIGVRQRPWYWRYFGPMQYVPWQTLSGSDAPVFAPANAISLYPFSFKNEKLSHIIRRMWSTLPLVWMANDDLSRWALDSYGSLARFYHTVPAGTELSSLGGFSPNINQKGQNLAIGMGADYALSVSTSSNTFDPNKAGVGADGSVTNRTQAWPQYMVAAHASMHPAGSVERTRAVAYGSYLAARLFHIQQPSLPGFGVFSSNYTDKSGGWNDTHYGARKSQGFNEFLFINSVFALYRGLFDGNNIALSTKSGLSTTTDVVFRHMLRKSVLSTWRCMWVFVESQGSLNAVPNPRGVESANAVAFSGPYAQFPVSTQYNMASIPSFDATGGVRRLYADQSDTLVPPPVGSYWPYYYPPTSGATNPSTLPVSPTFAVWLADVSNSAAATYGTPLNGSEVHANNNYPTPSAWVNPWPGIPTPTPAEVAARNATQYPGGGVSSVWLPPSTGSTSYSVSFPTFPAGKRYAGPLSFPINFLPWFADSVRMGLVQGSEASEVLRGIRAYFRALTGNYVDPLPQVILSAFSSDAAGSTLNYGYGPSAALAEEDPSMLSELNGVDPLPPSLPPTGIGGGATPLS